VKTFSNQANRREETVTSRFAQGKSKESIRKPASFSNQGKKIPNGNRGTTGI
jgi:hypothetical protein